MISYRNKTQKRVLALNRDLPPRNEQFLLDFVQIQSQFSVSYTTPLQLFVLRYNVNLISGFVMMLVSRVDFIPYYPGPRTIACRDGICPYISRRAV